MKSNEDKTILVLKITKETNENLVSNLIKNDVNEKFTTIDGEDYNINKGKILYICSSFFIICNRIINTNNNQ